MTVKDKATSLVEKYQNVETLQDYDGMYETLSIECAKIAVDEIINEWLKLDMFIQADNTGLKSKLKYWKEVKAELNKM